MQILSPALGPNSGWVRSFTDLNWAYEAYIGISGSGHMRNRHWLPDFVRCLKMPTELDAGPT